MEIKYYEDKYLDSLNLLLNDVFGKVKTYHNDSDNLELIGINGEEVIAYLALNKCINTLTGNVYFYVNYVCVKEECRGQGVALALFEKVFEICKDLGVTYLELTSNPQRVAAHELYKKLGFSVRETVVFRKELL